MVTSSGSACGSRPRGSRTSRSWIQASHKAWAQTPLTAMCPGGASANFSQSLSRNDHRSAANSLLLAASFSRVLPGAAPRALCTIAAGSLTGLKEASIRVGSPRRAELMDKRKNWLTLTRCSATSCTDHPSQRLGDDHSLDESCDKTSVNRFRWRMTGSDGFEINAATSITAGPSYRGVGGSFGSRVSRPKEYCLTDPPFGGSARRRTRM